MRFPHSHRLVTKAEFKNVFDDALKVSQKHVLILYKPNHKNHPRIGIIVGKRVANLAVSRNRIRRLVRESFRVYQEKLAGWDIVVIARGNCDTLTNLKLREGIDSLWERLLNQYLSK